MSLNKVMLIGNVGKDPEVRHFENGSVTSSFSLATTDRYKDKNSGETRETTEWHNIVCWRQLAEFSGKYIKKGTQLYIEGRIRTRSYTDQTGVTKYITEILADSIQLLGRKGDNTDNGRQNASQDISSPYSNSSAPKPVSKPAPAVQNFEEEPDDLPF